MSYTGTGTSDDPFVVDNWDDFVEVCKKWTGGSQSSATSSNYVEFKKPDNGKQLIIDMNEVAPQGVEFIGIIPISINGNGAIIRNLVNHRNGVFYFSHGSMLVNRDYGNFSVIVQNINFENTYLETSLFSCFNNNSSYKGGYGSVYFRNCTFSGIQSGGGVFDSRLGSRQAEKYFLESNSQYGCSLRIKMRGGSLKGPNGATIQLIDTYADLIDLPDDLAVINKCQNSYITGSTTNTSQNPSNLSISVVDMQLPEGGTIIGSNLTKTVINVDKCNGDDNVKVPDGATYDWIRATSEQLTNAEWLDQQGFPIGVD